MHSSISVGEGRERERWGVRSYGAEDRLGKTRTLVRAKQLAGPQPKPTRKGSEEKARAGGAGLRCQVRGGAGKEFRALTNAGHAGWVEAVAIVAVAGESVSHTDAPPIFAATQDPAFFSLEVPEAFETACGRKQRGGGVGWDQKAGGPPPMPASGSLPNPFTLSSGEKPLH